MTQIHCLIENECNFSTALHTQQIGQKFGKKEEEFTQN